MATKIGGDQLRLEDFIKNPAPNGDWTSSLFTASLAAIKDLMSASGIPELSGTVNLWEKNPGIYFLRESTALKLGRSRTYVENYDSIIILSNFFQGYNYKYYIIYNTVGQITYGQARETGGSAIFSKITPFQGASEQYQGSVGTVPAPQAGDNEKFLKGDGTWGEPDVFDGATSSAAGQKGAVPAPQAGYNEKFLKGDGTWGEPDVFDGATSAAAGQKGAVPAPQAGDNEKFLKGDGTWEEMNIFDGATSSAAGQKGAVPAPQAGDNEKFLKGDGTWCDRIEHITGEVNIWELNDGIYLFDEGFAINATNTQHYSPGEKGYISILQDPIYEYEKNYYAVTARGFMTYGVTSEYIGSINQAMLQTLSGSILEIGRGCLVPGKTNNETYYTLKGSGWTPGIISLLPEQYAYTWDKIQLKRVLQNGPISLFNCSEQYIKDFLLKGGKVIVWSRTESDETYRMYEADNENGTIQEGNVVLRNISYQNGKLVVSEFRAQTSGQTEYWQLTQHVI